MYFSSYITRIFLKNTNKFVLAIIMYVFINYNYNTLLVPYTTTQRRYTATADYFTAQ